MGKQTGIFLFKLNVPVKNTMPWTRRQGPQPMGFRSLYPLKVSVVVVVNKVRMYNINHSWIDMTSVLEECGNRKLLYPFNYIINTILCFVQSLLHVTILFILNWAYYLRRLKFLKNTCPHKGLISLAVIEGN